MKPKSTFPINPGPDVMAAQWREAIEDWRTGDPSTLDKMLRGRCDMPGFARVFLADALAGNEVRPRGKPRAPRDRPFALLGREAMILMDYEWFYMIAQASASIGKKRGEKSPKEKAFEAVSKKWGFKVKPGAVSHIVHKRRGR